MSAAKRRLLMIALALGGVVVAAGVLAVALLTQGDAASAPLAETAMPSMAPAVETPRAGRLASEEGAMAKVAAPAAESATDKSAVQELIVQRLGARRVTCAGACALEEQCGFRPREECMAASCEGDLRKPSRADFALAKASDCAAAALAPCEEACWKKGECTGEHQRDRGCSAACATLVQQLPEQTYRESRCVLERPCAELPLCAERG